MYSLFTNSTTYHSLLTSPSVLNYDPRVRHKKDNLLLVFLMPPKIPTASARKFYDLLTDELNKLYYTGIAGGALKGALIMMRNDQKGKEFDLGLRACTSYDAPCSGCEIMGDPGSGPFTKVSVGCYRRFLPPNHPHRRDARFGDPELRAPPHPRTKARCEQANTIIKEVQGSLPYYKVEAVNLYA